MVCGETFIGTPNSSYLKTQFVEEDELDVFDSNMGDDDLELPDESVIFADAVIISDEEDDHSMDFFSDIEEDSEDVYSDDYSDYYITDDIFSESEVESDSSSDSQLTDKSTIDSDANNDQSADST